MGGGERVRGRRSAQRGHRGAERLGLGGLHGGVGHGRRGYGRGGRRVAPLARGRRLHDDLLDGHVRPHRREQLAAEKAEKERKATAETNKKAEAQAKMKAEQERRSKSEAEEHKKAKEILKEETERWKEAEAGPGKATSARKKAAAAQTLIHTRRCRRRPM